MSLRESTALSAAALLLGATPAFATQASDFTCEPNPSPAPTDSLVPQNALLFGFSAGTLTDSNGLGVPTLPAPAPWNVDSRYRVPSQPLAANATYGLIFLLGPTSVAGQFQTLSQSDTQPPSAPGILWAASASNANSFSFCATDRTELFGLQPSTDDLAASTDLRYSLSQVLTDGGLALTYNELTPFLFPDGGQVLAVQYGLQGLPGAWVAQARDLAGNLSAPSNPQPVDIGTGCTFASSTTGRADGNAWLVLIALVALRRRRGLGRTNLVPGLCPGPRDRLWAGLLGGLRSRPLGLKCVDRR